MPSLEMTGQALQAARRQNPARAAKGGEAAQKKLYPLFTRNISEKNITEGEATPPAKKIEPSNVTPDRPKTPASFANNHDAQAVDLPNTQSPAVIPKPRKRQTNRGASATLSGKVQKRPPPKNNRTPPKKNRGNNTNRRVQPPRKTDDEVDTRPQPFCQPSVWADNRQNLCETLPYYRAFQSGPYTNNDLAHGFLLDNDNGVRCHMGEEVVITRAGGGYKLVENGFKQQATDQKGTTAQIHAFKTNKMRRVPVGLIVGSDNKHCPVKIPHRYCVMDFFQVTNIWTEKCDGKVAYKFRFEKILLQQKSWWAPAGSSLPSTKPSLVKAHRARCVTCGEESIQVYEVGWICLNQHCQKFWQLGGRTPPVDMPFHPAFLAERKPWPDHAKPPYELKPTTQRYDNQNPELQHSLGSWKGIVCPLCGRCISRVLWAQWECPTVGCDFVVPIKLTPLSHLAVMADHSVEYTGQALPLDKSIVPVIEHEPDFIGAWRLQIFEISPGNIVVHFTANQEINKQPGGPHDMFRTLQQTDIGLQRFPLENAAIKGDMLTKHFTSNFGMPYKFVVAVNSKGFSEAPKVIMDGLNRLTWAGQQTVRTLNKINRISNRASDEEYQDFNELLALGYLEKQSIGYHDDGEKDLGPTVATMSLGGDAVMTVRMKEGYYSAKKIAGDNYDCSQKVVAGCELETERLELRKLYQDPKSTEERKKQAKAYVITEAMKSKTRNAPPCLTMLVKHGDMVVMHGTELQSIYEHSVVPQSKLRFALTSRYIDPEKVEEDNRWKGDFVIPFEKAYDGSKKQTNVVGDLSSIDTTMNDSSSFELPAADST